MPAHNAASTLVRCLQALRAAIPAGSEIIVIDDGSFDDTRALAAEHADRVVALPCQAGAARARNEGARVATGDILLLVDADILVSAGAVAGLLANFVAKDLDVDAVFGAYTPLPPPEARSLATDYKNHLHHLTHLTGGRRPATTFWSGFSALRRNAFFAVGGFDSGVTRSADVEDVHLGYRLNNAGFEVFVDPRWQVQHLKRYNSRGLVASDLLHRAIPWTRAMVELRTFRSDLNLAGPSLFGVATFLLGAPLLIAGPFLGIRALTLAGVALVAGWIWTQRRLVSSCRRVGGTRFALAALAYGAAFNVYAPLGAMLGVAMFMLRPKNNSVRNTIDLDRKATTNATLALTIAIIVAADDERPLIESLISFFPPDDRYELIVVGTTAELDGLAQVARLIRCDPDEGPRDRSQRALDAANGRTISFLEPGLQPDADWIERALATGAMGYLVTGGSFDLIASTPAARAAAIAWFWPWRTGARRAWVEDHPLMNTVFDVAVFRQIGGMDERASIYRRLSVFGARSVRFDPTLRVTVGNDYRYRSMRQLFGLSRVQTAKMVAYYDNGRALRVARCLRSLPGPAIFVARCVRRTIAEGRADRIFWRGVPRLAVWSAAQSFGSIAGFVHRGDYRNVSLPAPAAEQVVTAH